MNMLYVKGLRFALSLVLALCALLPSVNSAFAQGADITMTIDELDTSSFPTIRVYVSVRDRNGVPVPNLTTEHFELIEDGTTPLRPSRVDDQINDQAQVSLAIVIDMYRTLSGEPIEAAQQATKDLLDDLLDTPNDADRAAFIGVRRGISTDPAEIDEEYEVPFTNDRNRLLNVINFLHERMDTSGPGTPLYDAIIKAVRLTAATEPVGHRAVIVMTDGEDVGSVSEDSDTIQSAVNHRTPVFTIGLSNSRLNEQYLTRLADQTGGVYQAAETPDDFSPLFSNVLAMLRTQYVLTYESNLPRDGQTHSLLVHVRTPTQLEGFQERRLDTPNPIETPEDPTETPISPSPTFTPTPNSNTGTTLQDWWDDLQQWIEDNMILAILILLGLGLLFLILLVVIIVVIIRRRRRSEEIPPVPEAPVYPDGPPTPFGGPDRDMPTTGRAEGPPPPAPTVGAEEAPSFDVPPFPGVEPPPPPPPPPSSEDAPPAAGATRIMTREPKMSQVGLLIDRKHPDRRFDIGKRMVKIGRTQDCDIVIDHGTISRQHATIKLEEEGFKIYDLGSTNGTFVSGERVREPVVLEDGVDVRLGEVELVFKIVSLET